MPIYAYRCERCGHAKDVIQKFSDAPLTHCPECGADAFRKQLTAPAFQLKGSGWYVTDFRDGGKKAGANPAAAADGTADAGKSDAGKAEGTTESAPAKAAEPAAAPAPSAPSTGGPAKTSTDT